MEDLSHQADFPATFFFSMQSLLTVRHGMESEKGFVQSVSGTWIYPALIGTIVGEVLFSAVAIISRLYLCCPGDSISSGNWRRGQNTMFCKAPQCSV